MNTLLLDLRFAARQLIKHRGFSVVAVLTLALGIGATTAIFSVVYGVLLRPLPYPHPEQLVGFAGTYEGHRAPQGVMYSQLHFLTERAWGMQHVAAAAQVGMDLASAGQADHLAGLRVTQDYFGTLGVVPALGRDFLPEEDQPSGPSVVILSHALWAARFGSDSAIVGRSVALDGRATTVIGVMPAGFRSVPAADAWSTLAQVGETVGDGTNLSVIGRLRPGVTATDANNHSAVVFADYHRTFLDAGVDSSLALSWVPYTSVMVADVQTPVRVLFGAIGFVLLIACANVASLVLGRTAGRQRELALRTALGASRTRVARQILTESVLLAVVGGAVGLAIATLGLPALLQLVPDSVPRAADVHIDGWALLFTFATAMITGVGFGLVPALLTARADPQQSLKSGGARTTGSAGQLRFRDLLVTAEIALALVLLSGAGLMIRTFANLTHVDAGFDPSHQVAAEIWLAGTRYDSTASIAAYYRDLTGRLDALPGVTSSAVVEAGLPLERGGNAALLLDGQPIRHQTDFRAVTPGYFQTLGVAVRQGRGLSPGDDAGGAPVIVVSQSFAHRFLNDQPLGRTLTLRGDSVPRTVVGVVGDVRSFIGDVPWPTVFLPTAQTPARFTMLFNGWFPIHVLVQTQGDPARAIEAVTRTIAAVDPQVPVGRVRSMAAVLSGSLSLERFELMLLSVFAGLAVTLAMVGVYGLISWFVAQATRDIGVRMALGARGTDVMRMVVGRGLILTGAGAVVGLVGALALTRLMTSLLYGVSAGDPLTLAGVVLLIVVVAVVACAIPARRAIRIDPVAALRAE